VEAGPSTGRPRALMPSPVPSEEAAQQNRSVLSDLRSTSMVSPSSRHMATRLRNPSRE
jgi:hypothetical protein